MKKNVIHGNHKICDKIQRKCANNVFHYVFQKQLIAGNQPLLYEKYYVLLVAVTTHILFILTILILSLVNLIQLNSQ